MGEYSDIDGHYQGHISEEDAYKKAKTVFGENITKEKLGNKTVFKRPDGKNIAEYTGQ
jgi:hypothetical protein